MRIAFISPKGEFFRHPDLQAFWDANPNMKTFRLHWSGLSMALPTLAALTPDGHDLTILDENVETVDLEGQYDLVAITATTQQAIRAYELGDAFKERGRKVVLGGVHASVLPDEALEHADSVVVGEAERLWPKVVQDVERCELRTMYRNEQAVDLADSPVPRFDLLRGKGYGIGWVQTTRGCPHDCEFCGASKLFGAKYRKKSVPQVLREIQVLREALGEVRLGFADDNFLVHRRFSKALLRALTTQGLRWIAQTDISVARDPELLELARESGCMHLFIGFESISEEGLDGIDRSGFKRRQLNRYAQDIAAIQSHGIGVMGSFIVGLDGDDMATFDRLEGFIRQTSLFDAQVTVLTPLPGTRLRERMKREGRILDAPWRDYTLSHVNFIHPRLSREEIETGVLRMFRFIQSDEMYRRKLDHFKAIHRGLRARDQKRC